MPRLNEIDLSEELINIKSCNREHFSISYDKRSRINPWKNTKYICQ